MKNKPIENRSRRIVPSREGIFWILGGAFAWVVFFRQTIFSGFELGIGGPGDSRLMLFLMEHWWLVLQGAVPFHQPLYFHGADGILATTDTFFMHAFVYAPLRLIGFDMFSAWHGVWFAWAGLGFSGMGWLLRKEIGVSAPWAIAGSILFILSTPIFMAVRAAHLQLLSLWLVPWLVIIALQVVRRWREPGRSWYYWAAGFAALYGLMAFSTFYIIWMATFYLCLALLIWILGTLFFQAARIGGYKFQYSVKLRRPVPFWEILREKRTWIAASFMLVGLVPLFLLYLPLLMADGGWAYQNAFRFLPQVSSWFNPGPHMLVYGDLFSDPGGEQFYGNTPLMWILFGLVLSGLFLSPRYKGSWLRLVCVVNLLLMLLLTKFGEQSLWYFVYRFIPGGDVIRAPFRVALITYASFPILLAVTADHVSRRGRLATTFCGCVLAGLVIDQINTVQMARISGPDLKAYLNSVPPPPPDATAFGLVPDPSVSEEFYEMQTRAMLLAAHFRLPTFNGLTGRFPDGFRHWNPKLPIYRYALESWALRHRILNTAYFYFEENQAWEPFKGLDLLPFEELSGINLVREDSLGLLLLQKGFSNPEPWGIWSDGLDSELLVPNWGHPVQVELDWYAFLPEKGLEVGVTVTLDGKEIRHWTFPGAPGVVPITIPPPDDPAVEFRVLGFHYSDARRPADYLRDSTDQRRLAIGFDAIRFLPSDGPGTTSVSSVGEL